MANRYLSFNHDSFDDIGLELFKLAISMTYANKTNRILALNNENYLNIYDVFIKSNYSKIDLNYTNYLRIRINDDYNESIDNLYIDFTNFNNFSYKLISSNIRSYLTLLITNNSKYINIIYNKINEIMNYFSDYNIHNFVCCNITKKTYNSNFYEKAYYRHYNNKKLIIRVDDIEWGKKSIDFIDNSFIYFIDASITANKYSDFIILTNFYNYIIDYDYYSWWIAYLTQIEKKVIVPNNNYDFYLSNWIKQS